MLLSNKLLMEMREFLIKYLGRVDFFTGRHLKPHEACIKPVFKNPGLEQDAIFNYVITSKFQTNIEISDEVIERLNYQTALLLKLTENNHSIEEQKFILQLKMNQELSILDSLFESHVESCEIISFDSFNTSNTTEIQ